jgi:hypothetical protein
MRPIFDVEEAIGKSVLVVANSAEEVRICSACSALQWFSKCVYIVPVCSRAPLHMCLFSSLIRAAVTLHASAACTNPMLPSTRALRSCVRSDLPLLFHVHVVLITLYSTQRNNACMYCEQTILGFKSQGRLLTASNYSKTPMPRTLRSVLLSGKPVPPGSEVTGL